jgi:hypothetical protein
VDRIFLAAVGHQHRGRGGAERQASKLQGNREQQS